MSNLSSTPVYKRSEFSALDYVEVALRKDLYRVYPTRYKALNPPAQAVEVYADVLEIPCIPKVEGQKGILVFLPKDFAEHLAHMAETPPQVYVHPDISLRSQAAYLGYSCARPVPELPLMLWLELSELMAAYAENVEIPMSDGVPVVLVAGDSMVVARFAPDEAQLQECRNALTAAQQRPADPGVTYLAMLHRKAESYGERPWLYMRYELVAGNQSSAVHWAPFGSLQSKLMGD